MRLAIQKIGGLRKIPELGKVPRPRRISLGAIIVTPRPVDWGPQEDPLEKAAAQGVPGTLPERIVLKWLIDNDHTFAPDVAAMGGQMVIGGAILDFVVYDLGPQPVALRIQGTYWHGPKFPDRQAKDDEQFWRLTAMGYKVVDLWEHDIYEAVRHERLNAYILEEVFA